MLKAHFISMFNDPIKAWLGSSIIARAIDKGVIASDVISILESLNFDHHRADDTPYGGGPGELLRIDVIAPLIEEALMKQPEISRINKRVLLMDPAADPFTQSDAKRLSNYQELVFVCGRYEGIDARIHHYVDEAISLGDFVLSSGDVAAMAIFDATARLVPGVLGNSCSTIEESHSEGRLEASNYTRPASYGDHHVPEVFKGGHHQKIARERQLESLRKTLKLRPDLLAKHPLRPSEVDLLGQNIATDREYPWMRIKE